MTQPSDWRERSAALDPSRSFIVQAPAGSGKTELLVQRMLGLLSQVEQPEDILAITFTRKAAAEMANRLFMELVDADKDHAEMPDQAHKQTSRELACKALANDSKRGWRLLQQPNRLRIKTIDSLCTDLARQLPVLSGLGRGFAIATRPENAYKEAANRALSSVEDAHDPLSLDIIRVLDRYDNQYDLLSDLLVSMLGNRDQWLPHLLDLRIDDGFNRRALEQSLEILLKVKLEELRALMPIALTSEIPRFFAFALENDPVDGSALDSLMHGCSNDGRLDLGLTSTDLPNWKTLAGRLITKNGKNWRKTVSKNDGFPAPSSASGQEADLYRAMKSEFLALLETQRENHELREALHSIMSLPEPVYADEDWKDLESLLRILLRTIEEWHLVSSASGEVDFIEVSSRARVALGGEQAPSDLALKLDYRIQHILVDEFQDTSSDQVGLLERLTDGWVSGDGRSMFLVGDPMQSIYRFRKAEVSLFIRAWRGEWFDHIELEPLRLSVNFRSGQAVVDWVNTAFPQVMPPVSDPVMGAVAYSKASPAPGATSGGGVSVHVGLDEDESAEAQRIVSLLLESGEDESIALLVRSRNHARAILTLLDSLREKDPRFRYRAVDFFRLNESPLVLDLMSLTLAIIQPADRLAWLALLRAPFCGLSLSELESLTGGQRDRLIVKQLVDFENSFESLADGDSPIRSRLSRIAPIMSDALVQYQRRPLRDVVEDTWLRLGGPASMRQAEELRDAETYLDLLSALQDEHVSIDRETLQTRLEHLYASADSSAGIRISVMTIYAAKGLEFDRVIIPGLNRQTAGDRGHLVRWFELAGTDQIVVSPMRKAQDRQRSLGEGDLMAFISRVERRRQDLELGRILYVAATRARNHLHLLGTVKRHANGTTTPPASSMLGLLWPAIEQDHSPFQAQTEEGTEESVSVTPGRQIRQVHRRFDANWVLPDSPQAIPTPESGLPDQPEYIEFSWAGEDARVGGSLVHRILQWMMQSGKSSGDFSAVENGLSSWCRTALCSRGIQGEKAESITKDVVFAVKSCLASETGKWVLGNHQQSESELAITAILEGQVRNLVIDRTFIDEDTRWIIDFKTSRHSGGDLEGFLMQESKRYAAQMRSYRKALSFVDDFPVRTALYYPVFDRLLEIDAK